MEEDYTYTFVILRQAVREKVFDLVRDFSSSLVIPQHPHDNLKEKTKQKKIVSHNTAMHRQTNSYL